MHSFPLKHFYVFIAILSCAAKGIYTTKTCPPAEIVDPCTCYQDNMFSVMRITCIDIKSPDTLEAIFTRMPNWHFEELMIRSSVMSYIPSSIFRNASFRHINVFDSTFASLFDQPLSSESLKYISLDKVELYHGIEWNLFSQSRGYLITLVKTTVKELGSSFREGIPETLVELVLDYCNTTHLNPNIFVKAKEFLSLQIEHGFLKKLDYGVFPKSIQLISLNYNQIETLPEGIFNDLTDLHTVSLKGNLLTTVKSGDFPEAILMLHLGGNPINCDCRLHWIVTTRSIVTGTCTYPSTVKGRDIHNLTKDDFSYCDY